MAEEREEEKEEEREGERKPPSKDVGADKKTTTGKIVAWLMEYKVYILAGLVLAGLAAWLAMRNKAASTQTQTTQPGYTAPTTTSAGTSSGGSSAGGGGGGGVLGAIEALGAAQQAANAANLASLQAANTANQAANETMLQKIQQEIAALHQHATQKISRGGTSGGNPITALQSIVTKGMSTVTAQHLKGMTLAQSPALTQIHNTVQSARETLAAAGQPFASTYNSAYVQNLLHGQTGNTISSSLASQIAAAGGGAKVGSSLILSTPKGLQKLAIESQPIPATAVAATHINHVPAQVAATKVAAMPYHAPVQVPRAHQLQGGL